MSTAALSDRGTAARELLAILYPPPHVVSGAGASGAPVQVRWIAIPTAVSPRLLVPMGPPVAATRMMRRQLTGRRPRTRLARAGLSLAMITGVLPRLPGTRLEVAGPRSAPSIEDPLCEILGVPTIGVTLPIGPARANRKAVLQLVDPAGEVLAFAKVGHNPLTRRLVRHESAALAQVAAAGLREVNAPVARGLLEWQGTSVLVLQALSIPGRRLNGAAARSRLLSLVAEVAAIGGRHDVMWGSHQFRERLLEQTLAHDPDGRLTRQLERVSPDLMLPTGSWHGDLNAGNLALVNGACPVWDWERFETGVPVGFDLLHHRLHAAIADGRVQPAVAAATLLGDAGSMLAPLGLAPAVAGAVARLYLLTLACRYLADDQRGAGADLGGVHEWLVPALEGAVR